MARPILQPSLADASAMSSRYEFREAPTVSAELLSMYMSTGEVADRASLIQRAKFPLANEICVGEIVRRRLRASLRKPRLGAQDFEPLLARLEADVRRHDEIRQRYAREELQAVRAFRGVFSRRFLKYQFGLPTVIRKAVSGVTVEMQSDATIFQNCDGGIKRGGMILQYSGSSFVGHTRAHLRRVASLLHWAIDFDDLYAAPRLCVLVDLPTGSVTRAAEGYERFRVRATTLCQEIAHTWNGIEPPTDYDGPAWC